jgi:pyruvate/2-oxoglutarate dehydrogenase complex dihydrolipoamide acyltransferase (E2) component
MMVEVRLPDLGAAPVELSAWFAEVGEHVYEGDRLVEVLTPGATFDVSAPADGRVVERLALPGDALAPGQVLALLLGEADPA